MPLHQNGKLTKKMFFKLVTCNYSFDPCSFHKDGILDTFLSCAVYTSNLIILTSGLKTGCVKHAYSVTFHLQHANDV